VQTGGIAQDNLQEKKFMSYTPTTFTDGAPPGISAEYLNGVESMLTSINSAATDGNISAVSGVLACLGLNANPEVVTKNGTTGTATLYQVLTGSVKAAILTFNNYQNSSASEQTIALPVAFTSKAWVFTGNFSNNLRLTPYYGGSASLSNVRVLTSFSTGGGTGSLVSQINAFSVAQITSHFDAIGLGVSETGTSTDLVFIVGM
jgi:hypothetical protein